MTSEIVVCCALLVQLPGFTAFRQIGQQQALHWNRQQVQISLQSDGSDDVNDGQDLQAMRAALATWQAALGENLQLGEGATSSSRSYGNDGVNRITFLESNWLPGADTALGTTLPNIVDGQFVDVDIVLNGQDGPWTVNGDPQGIDIRSVVTHELGHLIGLWHAVLPQAVMYTGARGGTTFRRALHADDLAGVRYLSSNLPCRDDDDCPLLVGSFGGEDLRLTCQQGSCHAGAGAYGSACTESDQCASGLCLRDPWTSNPDDPGFCTQSCSDQACPGLDLCKDVSGQPYCISHRDCLDDSDCSGGANVHCVFDFDGRYSCQRLCMTDQNCPEGQRCIDLGYGAGLCLQPGAEANGAECLSPLACMGLACRGDSQNLYCQTAAPRQDGGSVPDVPSVDRSAAPDAAVRRDAGVADLAPGDAGLPDTADIPLGPAPEQGCACRQAAHFQSVLPQSLLLLLLLALLRRARCSVKADKRY